MYLLDTSVVSETRRLRPQGAVMRWLESTSDANLHISAVTLAELQAGVEITRERDQAKAREIERWIDAVSGTYNVLPMDSKAFRSWARLMHRRSDALYEDAMIAATAMIHSLIVVTRNVRDFDQFDVRTFNPFD